MACEGLTKLCFKGTMSPGCTPASTNWMVFPRPPAAIHPVGYCRLQLLSAYASVPAAARGRVLHSPLGLGFTCLRANLRLNLTS